MDDGNGDTGMPPDGNGDTGMPLRMVMVDTGMPPDGDGTAVSLTSGGRIHSPMTLVQERLLLSMSLIPTG